MWPLFIELIVSFYIKITQGKLLLENSGNFILARMWPPCLNVNHLLNIGYFGFPGSVLYRWDVEERKVTSQCDISTLVPLGDENASCVTQGKISGAYLGYYTNKVFFQTFEY